MPTTSVAPRSLMPLALTLAGLSVASFFAGAVMLGIGATMSSSGGGVLSSITAALPSSGGPESAGFEDGHPVGLYFMTRYWIATHSLEKAAYYFTSDGKVYVDPQEGFSEDVLAKQKGRKGTISDDGGEMVVTWDDGSKEHSKLEKADGGFNWDMGIFTPVKPFTGREQLVGRWEGGSSVTVSGNWAASVMTLDLRGDGTFTGESAASFRNESADSVASGGSHGDHAGTWKLDDYSLVLNYSDGRTVRGVAFPVAERFYFAGATYKKL